MQNAVKVLPHFVHHRTLPKQIKNTMTDTRTFYEICKMLMAFENATEGLKQVCSKRIDSYENPSPNVVFICEFFITLFGIFVVGSILFVSSICMCELVGCAKSYIQCKNQKVNPNPNLEHDQDSGNK